MALREDPRPAEARAKPIADVAEILGIEGLRRLGRELTGPCPECGGRDRFSINSQKGVFNCRKCLATGDVIELVRWLRKITLPEALTWLCGEAQEIDDAERARREKRAQQNRARAEQQENRYRTKAITQARRIWREGQPAEDTPVRDYLALRGIGRDLLPDLPRVLRYHPDLPYMLDAGAGWIEVHRGPAMLAVVQQAGGQGIGVHRTWIDLARPRGKALIEHQGEAQKVKKTWGMVKGGAIRLHTPRGSWDTLVLAEGIETALTALISGVYPGAAVWAGVSLGNMSGRMRQGKGLRYAGLPDLADAEAFTPPPWVRQLILIEDGDSEPRMTRARMMACARRAMARVPGLVGRVVPCPAGRDLNDVLLEGVSDE